MNLELLNAKEVCKIFRISPYTLRYWRLTGKIPYRKLGQTIRFTRSDVQKVIDDNKMIANEYVKPKPGRSDMR